MAITVLLGSIAVARPAAAEPQARPGTRSPKAQKRQTKEKPAAPPARAGFGLAEMAARAAAGPAEADLGTGKAEARRLDLTPQRQFETGKVTGTDRRGGERSSAVMLPEDADWRVQAVEIGAMAAMFGTLVAVCGSGRCLLPFGGGGENLGPPADLEIREQPALRDPR